MSELNDKEYVDEKSDAVTADGSEESTVSSAKGTPNAPNNERILSNLIDYVEIFTVAICIVILLFTVAFRTCTVDGASMNNTLINGEALIISDLCYTPKRGDIIVFHQTGDDAWDKNEPLVKRVIGVGGDTVRIDYDSWTVTVTDADGNEAVLNEPYIYLSERRSFFTGTAEYAVPEGSLFVLGDNRNESLDSRFEEIGFVDSRRVLGKVILRASPISKFGTVN